jgi:hypothetical protein
LKAGDAFLLQQQGASIDSHFWFILSDADQDADNVLIVNLTSWRADKDQACVLGPNHHTYIQHDTCVNYGGAKVVSLAQLNTLKDTGLLLHQTPLTAGLLKLVRERVSRSTTMKLKHVEILEQQGLVDL